jgi:hypothetical protein
MKEMGRKGGNGRSEKKGGGVGRKTERDGNVREGKMFQEYKKIIKFYHLIV